MKLVGADMADIGAVLEATRIAIVARDSAWLQSTTAAQLLARSARKVALPPSAQGQLEELQQFLSPGRPLDWAGAQRAISNLLRELAG